MTSKRTQLFSWRSLSMHDGRHGWVDARLFVTYMGELGMIESVDPALDFSKQANYLASRYPNQYKMWRIVQRLRGEA